MTVPIPSYQEHQDFIATILDKDMKDVQFKNKIEYTKVLENLPRDKGAQYLQQIEQEFPQVTFEDIRTFININDMYGGSVKTIYTMNNVKLLYCSPTTLRYIYHALHILKYYQETNSKHIVELGQGYGGLFLAINVFSKKFPDLQLESYTMIDLPNSNQLTTKYLQQHQDHITFSWKTQDKDEISWDTIPDDKTTDPTFFISNYCFTAIPQEERQRYADMVIQKCAHGFLTWQTCFGADVNQADQILKQSTIRTAEETPQTAHPSIKNYYVYF
jgi:hypothetical protein